MNKNYLLYAIFFFLLVDISHTIELEARINSSDNDVYEIGTGNITDGLPVIEHRLGYIGAYRIQL